MLTIDAHGDVVKCVKLFSYGELPSVALFNNIHVVFSGSSDKYARAFNLQTGKLICKYEGHRRGIEDIIVNSFGDNLFTASSDGSIRQFNVYDASCLAVFDGHETSVYALHLPPDEEDETIWSSTCRSKAC